MRHQTSQVKSIPVLELSIVFVLVSLLGLIAVSVAWLVSDLPSLLTLTLIQSCRNLVFKPDLLALGIKSFFASALLIGVLGVGLRTVATVMGYIYYWQWITRRQVEVRSYISSRLLETWPFTQQLILIDSNQLVACTFGYFKPRIVLSTQLVQRLSKPQLEAVILHELYHLKNRHGLILLLGTLCKATLFLIPILKDWLAIAHKLFETKADEFVVSMQGSSLYLHHAVEIVGSATTTTALAGSVEFAQLRQTSINQLWTKTLLLKTAFTIIICGGLFGWMSLTRPVHIMASQESLPTNCPVRVVPTRTVCLVPSTEAKVCQSELYTPWSSSNP